MVSDKECTLVAGLSEGLQCEVFLVRNAVKARALLALTLLFILLLAPILLELEPALQQKSLEGAAHTLRVERAIDLAIAPQLVAGKEIGKLGQVELLAQAIEHPHELGALRVGEILSAPHEIHHARHLQLEPVERQGRAMLAGYMVEPRNFSVRGQLCERAPGLHNLGANGGVVALKDVERLSLPRATVRGSRLRRCRHRGRV